MLTDGRADGTGECPGLDVGHAHLAVLGAPGRLVGVDTQTQEPGFEVVAGTRAVRRGPMRQVVVDPPIWSEPTAREVFGELRHVPAALRGTDIGEHPAQFASYESGWAPFMTKQDVRRQR
jgi:hypothetical protein